MKHFGKRFLSLLLCFAMLISIMPATALAANNKTNRMLKRIVVTIKKPKAGDSLYYEAKVPARANYTAKIRWWLEYTSLNTGREMNDSEKFQANKTYLAQVEVTPKAGFHISREALVTVNGESAGRVSEDALTDSKDYRWEYLVPDGPYTVSYNSNGAAGQMEATPDVYELTLPECDFTAPAGKFFGGWLVDGMDGAKWFPGDTIKIK
ncbi:MAG: hypothetical protein J5968_04015, partial [Oscillospiraceae bacterium]|nr:hypothetical protein [Oscillospiraceae bacterium]